MKSKWITPGISAVMLLGLELICLRPAWAVPATSITTCNSQITVSGFYVLANDIGPCAGNGVSIKNVVNVNFDLNGHTITGSNTATGILIKDSAGITIKNADTAAGVITHFGRDIDLQASSNVNITGMTHAILAEDANVAGMRVDSASCCINITNVDFEANSTGVKISDLARNVNFDNVDIDENGIGIDVGRFASTITGMSMIWSANTLCDAKLRIGADAIFSPPPPDTKC